MAERIRRRRAKGWRLPEGAVCVDRSTPWGNPFVVGQDGNRETCVYLYRALLSGHFVLTCKTTVEDQRRARSHAQSHIHELIGKDLACWCDAGPCHADVLLAAAARLEEKAVKNG